MEDRQKSDAVGADKLSVLSQIPSELDGNAESLFAMLFEDAPVGMLVTMPDGRFVTCNRRFAELLGYSKEEVAGRPFHSFTHPDDVGASVELIEAANRGDSDSMHFEKRYIHKDGRSIWAELTSQVTRNADGTPHHYVTHVLDISARKEAEAKVAAAYTLQSTMVEGMACGVVLVDRDGRIFAANPAAEEIFGEPLAVIREKPISTPRWNVVAPDGGPFPVEERPVMRVLRTRAPHKGVLRLIRSDGEQRLLDTHAVPILDAKAELSHVVVSYVDLTARQRAEQERDRFFSRARALLATLTNAGAFRRTNPELQRVFGRQESVLEGLLLYEFVPKEDEPLLRGAIESLGKAGGERTVECRVRISDGSVRWIAWGLSSSPQDETIYAVGRDVTLEREAEQLKSGFISTVSHELRTPLTSILGALKLLAGGVLGPIPAGQVDLIRIAVSSSDRLLRIVNDILDFDKATTSGLGLVLAPADAGTMVHDAIRAMTGASATAQVILQAKLSDVPPVLVDEGRGQQVLQNLISNAIKFSPALGTVTVRTRQVDAGSIRFEVADQGPGISVADQRRLFQRFQQLDNSTTRKVGGTGLGLAIVKAIVKEHGGTLGVESTLGVGSTFWFELPAAAGT